MRIIHVEDYFDPNAGYQINELLLASKDSNEDIILITSNDMSPFHKKVDLISDENFEEKTGVKILRLESRFKISGRLLLKNLNKTIKKYNPDVVFMHGIGDFKDIQLFKTKSNYKIIRDCHMSWVASVNRLRYIYYWLFKLSFARRINKTDIYDVIYALGIEEYEYLINLGIDEDKIDYLPHGYNDTIMYYDEEERNNIRIEYGFKERDIIISYIGKMNYAKRPDLIFDIIGKIDEELLFSKKIKLLFIGPKDDTYMSVFYEKNKSFNDKIVTILDDPKPFGELRKFYSASDICIFPKETTLSSIHAQVCGCAVIMENHKSNIERVTNNDNLYQIDNLEQASIILKRLITNEEFRDFHKIKNELKNREYKSQIDKFMVRINSNN